MAKRSRDPAVSDPLRPFTECTWRLIVIMLAEDGAGPADIAHTLNRDPDHMAAQIAGAQASGQLSEVWRDLMARNGLHAVRVRRRLRGIASGS